MQMSNSCKSKTTLEVSPLPATLSDWAIALQQGFAARPHPFHPQWSTQSTAIENNLPLGKFLILNLPQNLAKTNYHTKAPG